MAEKKYQVVFRGAFLEGFDPEQVEASIRANFKVSEKQIAAFLSGREFVVQKNLSEEDVYRFHAQLTRLGLDVAVASMPETTSLSLADEPGAPAGKETPNDSKTKAGSDDPYRAPQAQTTKENLFCRQCGKSMPATATACPACGATQNTGTRKSRAVAALLAFFLGGFGIHRFYLGQWWGIFYIIFLYIGGVVAFFESIIFALTPRERWDRKYGNVTSSVGLMVGVGVLGGIMVIGILAAIALPAYQDYTIRAKIAEALAEVQPHKQVVSEFILRTNFVPNQNIDAGLPNEISSEYLESLTINPGGSMTATFRNLTENTNGATILFVPSIQPDTVTWDCSGGTLEKRYRPAACRNGGYGASNFTEPVSRQITSSDGLIHVTIPGNWQQIPELNDVANIEVGNESEATYLITITDYKVDLPGYDLFDFGELVVENMQVTEYDQLGVTYINNMPSQAYRFNFISEGVKLEMMLTAFEGEDHFHQLLVWTVGSRWMENESSFQDIVQSFAEIN